MTTKSDDPFGLAELINSLIGGFETKTTTTWTTSDPAPPFAPKRMRTDKFEVMRLSEFPGITVKEVLELAEAGRLYKLLDVKVKGKVQLRRVPREEAMFLHKYGYHAALSGLYRRLD